jgi:DNA processing protein
LHYYLKHWKNTLIQKIVDNGGLVLSEFKLDFVPTPYSFPQRNKIIARLADCIFIPE